MMDSSAMFLLILYLTHLLVDVAAPEVSRPYGSTIKLEQLVESEKRVINQMKLYIEERQSDGNTKHLARYVKKIMKSVTSRSAPEIVSHPVDAFHFLRDVVLEWNAMRREMNNNSDNLTEFLNSLQDYRNDQGYPIENDIYDAAVPIARIQYIYELRTEDLQQGTILLPAYDKEVFYSREQLNSFDCLVIGQAAINQSWYHIGIDWMKVAERLNKDGDHSADIEKIDSKLKHAMLTHDTVLIQQGPQGPTWETYESPVTDAYVNTRKQWPSKPRFQSKLFQWMDKLDLDMHARKLCQGQQLRDPSIDASLTCRYLTNNNPYLLIGPFKYEEISQDPAIMVFHNFVYESEMERMKEISIPQLMDSPIIYGSSFGSSSRRISQQCWIEDETNPTLMPRMARRLTDATLLNNVGRNSSKQYKFKVTNYGIAGHFEVHKDYFQDAKIPNSENPFLDKRGDQIATFLMYLSDVPAGGATVFPIVGVSVTPQKGSAVFFYNIDKTGLPDPSTLHAGCPVLYGSKWIALKWMYAYDQDLMCGSHSLEKHILL